MWAEIEFDINRVILNDDLRTPPFRVKQTRLLRDTLTDKEVPPGTSVLLIERDDFVLVFVTVEMVFHRVAQIELAGEPLMVSFCAICNAGMGFSPVVDGKTYHFTEHGLYNAMTILGDEETGSYWDHLTGKCLHGPMQGKELAHVASLRHSTAEQALAAHPNAQIALARLSSGIMREVVKWDVQRTAPEPAFPFDSFTSLSVEDARLPRLDMGMGIWEEQSARYYPITRLHGHNNAVIDTLNGRSVLLYIDPASDTPSAMYIDENVTHVTWIGDALRLNTGATIRDTALYDAHGIRQKVERPMQLFVRWYSFAFAFPGCEIYAA
jgi:hypothetical protein